MAVYRGSMAAAAEPKWRAQQGAQQQEEQQRRTAVSRRRRSSAALLLQTQPKFQIHLGAAIAACFIQIQIANF